MCYRNVLLTVGSSGGCLTRGGRCSLFSRMGMGAGRRLRLAAADISSSVVVGAIFALTGTFAHGPGVLPRNSSLCTA